MKQPAWDDPKLSAGTMVRGALWLLQVVGEGNTFTKKQLRDAFPGVSQADRRIRDLRDYGWIVRSSTEDASLLAEDQRFVAAGVSVWDPQERKGLASRRTISNKERIAILSRDGYMCTLCGIAGAESYWDAPVTTAVISITRRKFYSFDGVESEELVTECNRCRAGRDSVPTDMGAVVTAANSLSGRDRQRFLRWIERGRRGTTELDRVWGAYLAIPADLRPAVADRIRNES